MDQEHQITLLLPRARLSPVISTMPEGLPPGVIFYPHTRCGNPCLGKTVALKFLDSHPRESIKTNNGLYPKCPYRGKSSLLLVAKGAPYGPESSETHSREAVSRLPARLAWPSGSRLAQIQGKGDL